MRIPVRSVLASVLAAAILVGAAPAPHDGLHIYFIDVNQGDSTLIVAPTGESMLIDTGTGGQVPAIQAAMADAGVERVVRLRVIPEGR